MEVARGWRYHGSSWLVGVAGQKTGARELVIPLLIVCLVLYVAGVYQRRRERSIPGPWPWPIVGSLPVLHSELPHKALQKLSNKYGGLMYLQLGQKSCLVVSTAESAREVFRKHDATFASRPRMLACDIITNGTYRSLSFAPYGPFWRQLRRVANTQLFSPGVHSSHERIRTVEMQHMLRDLVEDTRKGKNAINLKSWLTGATANNMTMMLTNNRYFGAAASAENQKTKRELDELMRRSFAAIGSYIISDYVPALNFVTKLQGWLTELQGVRALGAQIVSKIIQVDKHREKAKERGDHDTTHVPDFVDVLLKAPLNDGDLLPDCDIVTLIVCLMNAGTDTIANIVEWGMSELMANPSIRKQAVAEIDAVVGQDRLVQESDHANLPFLQAIVKETYRMHPPLPLGLRRESHEPCVIFGCELPVHTELIINTYAIHHDSNTYKSPYEFRPSRFLDHPEVDPMSGHDYYELIPFGIGRRMCPGYNLGNVMVTSMFAQLLQCFDWELPEGQSAETLDMSEYYSFLSFRRTPLCLIAHPRAAASLLMREQQQA